MPKLRVGFYFLWLFFFFSSTAIAFTPENGWWWNPAESGRGFNIETQDRTIYVATFIYDESGNPIWYSGSGELHENGAVTVPALRFEGGQCIGCPFQSPQITSDAGPLNLQFTSEITAIIHWAGTTVPIERFNFKLGDNFQKLLGEWMLVIGNPEAPPYAGERLLLGEISVQEGQRFVLGHRTGAPDNALIVLPVAEEGSNEVIFAALLASSPNALRSFLFRWAGLNAIEGVSAVSEGAGIAEGVIDAEQIVEDLLAAGVPFIGKRHHGAMDVGAAPLGGAVPSHLSAGDKSRSTVKPGGHNALDQGANFLLSPEGLPMSSLPAESGLTIPRERLLELLEKAAQGLL